MKNANLCMVVLAAAASGAQAQMAFGDWIISNRDEANQGVYRVDPATGVWENLTAGDVVYYSGLAMAADNYTLLALNSRTYGFDSLDPQMGAAPGPRLTTVPGQIAAEQSGTYLTAQDYGLFRVDPSTGAETLVWFAFNQSLRGVCIDGATGDFVTSGLGPFFYGTLTRVDPNTLLHTIIATGLGNVNTVAYHAVSGDFLVANGDFRFPVLRVSPTGAVSVFSTVAPSGAKTLRIDPATGNVLVAGVNAVSLLSQNGALLMTHATPAPFTEALGAEIYGSAICSTSGHAAGGYDFAVHFRDPSAGGRLYIAAVSDALSPGFPFNDGTGYCVCLELNDLFWATFGGLPGLVDGFSGALDSNGVAQGFIRLPEGFPAGVRLHVEALIEDPTKPYGVRPTNPTSFTTL
jgi:sugar lactone lactonase YvrE